MAALHIYEQNSYHNDTQEVTNRASDLKFVDDLVTTLICHEWKFFKILVVDLPLCSTRNYSGSKERYSTYLTSHHHVIPNFKRLEKRRQVERKYRKIFTALSFEFMALEKTDSVEKFREMDLGECSATKINRC